MLFKIYVNNSFYYLVLINVNNVENTGLSYSNDLNDKDVVDNSNLYHEGSVIHFFFL